MCACESDGKSKKVLILSYKRVGVFIVWTKTINW